MDIISRLSDDLLVRILSFNPTKDAIVTSPLSKRWRSLWTLVPKLEYECIRNQEQRFTKFVYRTMLLNKAPVLERLNLKIHKLGPECNAVDVGIWIDIAVSRKVSALVVDICFYREGSISCFPRSLYSCETLESLTLTNHHSFLVDVPSEVCLPSLRKLCLKVVDLAVNASLHRVLSGCPNLEELSLTRLDCVQGADQSMDFTIDVPSLKILSVIDKRRSVESSNGYVINAPSLTYLRINDDLLYDNRRMKHMPELVTADVGITNGVTNHKFLKALTCVRRLDLCLSLSEVVNPPEMIFHQLVELNLSTCDQGWWDLLTHMLQNSPKLQILKLVNVRNNRVKDQSSLGTPDCWKRPSSVPECFLNGFETFKWNGYKGRQGDREVATFVLTNAIHLKIATFLPESTDFKEKYGMLKELASLPTPSPSSQLLFDGTF